MTEKLIQSSEAPEETYFSEREEDDGDSDTSCGTLKARNRPDWMGDMGPKFMDAKVGEVYWPGTHNSGAYCEKFDFSRVVDNHWLRFAGTYLLQCAGPTCRQFASDWSRTQVLNVQQQLEHGVRYLDLRISKCVRDGRYYIVHSFCGPKFEDVLEEIVSFIGAHNEECLLLEVTPVSDVDHAEVHALVERKLGGFALKRECDSYYRSPMTLTVAYLMEKGRIVVLYKLPAMYGNTESVLCFWDSRSIHAPFIRSLNPTIKELYQLERFTHFIEKYHKPDKKRHKSIFHFMYALTPSFGEIVKSFPLECFQSNSSASRSLQDCAERFNPKLGQFMEKIAHKVELEQCQDLGMIVSADYVEESDLMQQMLSLNTSKFRSAHFLSLDD